LYDPLLHGSEKKFIGPELKRKNKRREPVCKKILDLVAIVKAQILSQLQTSSFEPF
jgi:hypothetical protein